MSQRKRAALITLGCKVNWYDSRAMEEALVAAGFSIVSEGAEADVYIVNTCAVTAEAERKSRQALRKMAKLHPDAVVIASGCYAQRDPAGVAGIGGVAAVHGTANRAEIASVAVDALDGAVGSAGLAAHADAFEDITAATQQGHTRAVIKIEDGCDAFCAYCIIPHLRGAPRSRPMGSIAKEAEALAGRGFAEIVLVGINLARYGVGLPQGCELADAVESVALPGIRRIRLGSLEPDAVTDGLLRRLHALPQFCPHFHLSLQSGCADTLTRMGRRYTPDEYAQKVGLIRSWFPQAGITTDVIVGFPGETMVEFAQSVTFVRSIGFLKVHVFPYSRRAGTAAADMPNQLDKAAKEARAAAMQAVAAEGAATFRRAMLGQTVEVLFEEGAGEGWSKGYTLNYVEVMVPVGNAAGKLVNIRLTGIEDDRMIGEPIS